MRILIGYATRHGSTRRVAERLGFRIQQFGIEAKVQPLHDMQDDMAYDGAIIGSAVHDGRWLPEATSFVEQFGPLLRGRPIWLFSISTLGDEESMFPPWVAKRLRALRKPSPELTEFQHVLAPVSHRNFAGAIDRDDWPVRGRAVFRLMGGRYGEHQNWAAIDLWADEIASHLLAHLPPDPTAPAN